MRDAFNAIGRLKLYSAHGMICGEIIDLLYSNLISIQWDMGKLATWAANADNSWRTAPEVADNYRSMIEIIDFAKIHMIPSWHLWYKNLLFRFRTMSTQIEQGLWRLSTMGSWMDSGEWQIEISLQWTPFFSCFYSLNVVFLDGPNVDMYEYT